MSVEGEFSQEFRAFMDGLRALCRELPEAEEYLMHGHPSFRAGKKCFLIAGEGESGLGVSVKVPILDQPLYLENPRFTRTHYIGQHGWVDFEVGHSVQWDEIERLVGISYRGAANKRMLKALETKRA